MTRCNDVRRLGSAYIDGELDEARSSALRGHLRMCPRCAALVGELAEIRDAAADLAALDPPPALWAAVEQGLAEAEMSDARRSRLWLHWHQLRPRLLTAAVAVTAVATVCVWLWGDALVPAAQDRVASERASASAAVDGAAQAGDRSEFATGQPETGAGGDVSTRFTKEIERTDRHYTAVRAELHQIIAEERAHWPSQASTQLDARLAAFAADAESHQRALASAAASDSRSRDALYAVYQAEIKFLQRAAIQGPAALAAAEAMP